MFTSNLSVRARLASAAAATLQRFGRSPVTRTSRRVAVEPLETRILFGYFSADPIDQIPIPPTSKPGQL